MVRLIAGIPRSLSHTDTIALRCRYGNDANTYVPSIHLSTMLLFFPRTRETMIDRSKRVPGIVILFAGSNLAFIAETGRSYNYRKFIPCSRLFTRERNSFSFEYLLPRRLSCFVILCVIVERFVASTETWHLLFVIIRCYFYISVHGVLTFHI